MLGNDNSSDPPGFRMTPLQYAKSPYYVKLETVVEKAPIKDPSNRKDLENVLQNLFYHFCDDMRELSRNCNFENDYGYPHFRTFDDSKIYVDHQKYNRDTKEVDVTKSDSYTYTIIKNTEQV